MRAATILHSKGYILLRKPEHPYANCAGFVPEHRIVMEAIIGRYINPEIEVAHHNDHNVKNNNPENLTLLSKKEHRRIHNGWEKINGEWWKSCSRCGAFLPVEGNFYQRRNGHNEYVSQCKVCIREIGCIRRRNHEVIKDRIVICPVCGKVKYTRRGEKSIYCSIKCHWVVRKGALKLSVNAPGV